MDVSKLWTAWPVPGPWHISPLRGGTNNPVWRVETVDGQAYVLRLSSDINSLPRIRYEAALLQALDDKQLPFLLPLPLKAHTDDIIVRFEQATGAQALASLYPLLPGKQPDRNDPVQAAKAASTLALLDVTLATLPEIHTPDGFQALPPFGEFTCWHPLVPDPLVAVERLPIDYEQARQIRRLLGIVIERVSNLYDRLPQQMLHRDYDPGNILMDEQGVTAVLDFEFAGRDVRVLDLCVALSWWPVNLLGTGKEWDLIDVFGRTYVTHFPLSEEELLAISDVWRLRDSTSLVHRMGRYLAGLETDMRMQDRVKHSLWREEWLSTNQKTLLQHALAWLSNDNGSMH
ncbi:MAG: phosphotransferase enzyme family protein [Ktedonobacteraceae bacterium]